MVCVLIGKRWEREFGREAGNVFVARLVVSVLPVAIFCFSIGVLREIKVCLVGATVARRDDARRDERLVFTSFICCRVFMILMGYQTYNWTLCELSLGMLMMLDHIALSFLLYLRQITRGGFLLRVPVQVSMTYLVL